MSFRFVGTALTILSTTSASGLYFANGMPASAPHGATVVVPVVQAAAPTAGERMVAAPGTDPQIKAVVGAKDVWRPRIWVGSGATVNPVTGEPLSHDEQESGWVDGPDVFAREVVRVAADPVTGALKAMREPNPEVLVLKPGQKAPAWVRGTDVALAPGVEIEDAPPPPPPAAAPMAMTAPAPAPAKADTAKHHRTRTTTAHAATAHTAATPAAAATATAAAEGGYHIHLESYHAEQATPRAWAALQKANPAVLGSLKVSTAAVDVPNKGHFVRLLAGSFENRAAAEKACTAIKKDHPGQYCHPVAPGREAS
ncbi:MAG: SPOR domain-containing protein [Rhodospirillaceae bacterium]